MQNKIKLKVTITIPEEEMEQYEAWNFGKNLLKSSLQTIRQIGFNICSQILVHDGAIGLPTLRKRGEIMNDLSNRNNS